MANQKSNLSFQQCFSSFSSFASFLPLSKEISSTWTKDQSNNDINRQIIDFKGDLNSWGEFTCPNGDYFEGQFFGSFSDRSGHLTKPRESGCFTVGLWKSGLLDGIVDMETEGGGWKRVAFKKGLKHGLERSFEGAYPKVNNPKRVACYQEDEIVGPVWKFLPGGAFLLGPVDPETEEFVGKSVVFIYPDCQTAICGRFAHGTFISGYTCTIESIQINLHDDNLSLLPHIKVSMEKLGPMVKRDVSTKSIIGKYPLDPDWWESNIVEVKSSNLNDPNAGQGLFLKKSVSKGQIVALFNGIRYLTSHHRINECPDEGLHQNYDYRIRLNGETDIDIPPQYTSLERYCATLGHKANHSFTPNAKWSRLEHPRFGLICAIQVLEDLPRGSEILVNYGMRMSDAPLWYKSLWVEHLRRTKNYSDEEILYWCARQKSMNGRLIDLPF